MDGGKWLAGGDRFSNFFVKHDSDRRIDRIFFALPPATENYTRGSHLFALQRCQVSISGTRDCHPMPGLRKLGWIVDRADISALQFHHLPEFLEHLAGSNQLFASLFSFCDTI